MADPRPVYAGDPGYEMKLPSGEYVVLNTGDPLPNGIDPENVSPELWTPPVPKPPKSPAGKE